MSTEENGPEVAPSDTLHNLPLKELIPLAIIIILFTAGITYAFHLSYAQLDNYQKLVAVQWEGSEEYSLRTPPSWFLHEKDSLKTIKPITTEEKLFLLSLSSVDSSYTSSYEKAINELTFYSNRTSQIPTNIILLIGALAAVLGVQIRTMFDFVGRACYKKNIDLKIWWPWYTIRPFLGFLVGGVVVVFLESSIIKNVAFTNVSNLSLIGITVLAGFGVTDVVDLLRKLSKKIFGTEET